MSEEEQPARKRWEDMNPMEQVVASARFHRWYGMEPWTVAGSVAEIMWQHLPVGFTMKSELPADRFGIKEARAILAACERLAKEYAERDKPALDLILAERDRQDQRWGGAAHDDQHSDSVWAWLLWDRLGYLNQAIGHPVEFRRQLIIYAALNLAAISSMLRQRDPNEVDDGRRVRMVTVQGESNPVLRLPEADDVR